jgi:diadenylate cyclase
MHSLFNFLLSLRWQDAVDIALNGYILFRLYVLFRGTNTFRALIGIALLWFFQRIAVSAGLIITSWVFQGITAFAALIIIVIFRNEIRTVLQVKNLGAILWELPRHNAKAPIEIIVESVFALRRRKVGALIVLPGNDDLSEIVHSGIPWQGLVSREMITGIFWEDNPVHDGAAIIMGNQVSEVGAILPLSHRKDLPTYYGTRHRAAAGLAEKTDALSIVVSEERGTVSIAKGPYFNAMNREEDLAEALREHIGVSSKQEDKMWRETVELGTAALISLLVVTGIWFSFARGVDTLVTFDIPIEYMNRDPSMEILDTSVDAVRLELAGSAALIRSLKPDQVKVKVDLSKSTLGSDRFIITPENVSLPPGVYLKNVKTPVVEVTLDLLSKKELFVQVDWAGKLSDQLAITGVKLDPEKIQVIGGKRVLESMTTIYTEKVWVDALDKSGTTSAKLVPSPASVRISPASRDRATIEYTIKKKQE